MTITRPDIPFQVITPDDVRESVRRARVSLERAAEEIVWQVEREAWVTLGYSSWNEMREAEYGGIAVMVPRTSRPEIVSQLRSAGLTQQETADTIGVSTKTIKRDEHPERQGTNVPSDEDAPEPRKQRRRPITDAFFTATYDLRKRVESVHRLTEDERFSRNAETLAGHRNDLIRLRDQIDEVIDRIPER